MLREYKLLVKNSNFVYVWISQIFSQLTINIMNFLLLIGLFAKTQSAIATSFLWVSYSLPAILVGPVAAASADMIDRRKILMISNLLQALTILSFAFLHETRFFLIYGVVFIYSFLNQFYVPAESASIPSLVAQKDLPLANGLFFVTQQVSVVLGFGSAGLLVTYLGFRNSVLMCAVFLFIAFISVSFLPELRVKDSIPKNFEDAFIKFFQRIIEGYRFIKSHREIILPFSILIGIQIGLAIATVNLPIVARDILNIALNFSGIAIAVPAGLGAISAALIIPKLLKAKIRKRKLIEISFIIMAFSTLALAIFTPNLGQFAKVFFGLIFIFLIGFSFIGVTIPSQTFLQEKTPGGLRGRVFGNYWFLVTMGTMIPVLLSGTIIEIFGVRFLFAIMGLLLSFAYLVSRKYEVI